MSRMKPSEPKPPIVWTIVGFTCITLGILLWSEWPDGSYRAFLGVPLTWATGIFALIVAAIEWSKWFRHRRMLRSKNPRNHS